MALKDITLGQFFPGNSFLHKLDPRCKLLLVVFFIVSLFVAKNAAGYGLMLAVLLICILASKVGFKAILRGMKPIFFIVVFTAVLNLLYTPGTGTPLVEFWIFHIYK